MSPTEFYSAESSASVHPTDQVTIQSLQHRNSQGTPIVAPTAYDYSTALVVDEDTQGKISFVEHMVMADFSTKNAGGVTFSELHGSTFADVDGDGIPDFIVGKRYFSPLDTNIDPDPRGAPVLYWYKTVRDAKAPGGARLEPHLIDNHSGSGSNVLAVDLNKDGAMDIVADLVRHL
jgi:hypothetical protein